MQRARRPLSQYGASRTPRRAQRRENSRVGPYPYSSIRTVATIAADSATGEGALYRFQEISDTKIRQKIDIMHTVI